MQVCQVREIGARRARRRPAVTRAELQLCNSAASYFHDATETDFQKERCKTKKNNLERIWSKNCFEKIISILKAAIEE